MKAFKRICMFFLAVLLPGCDSLIDLNPESSISVNSFWKTEEDAQGGLVGMYNQFREFTRANLILLGEARSETMGNGLANADFRIKYFENTLSETNADLGWQQLYRIVNYANLVLKYVPDISFKNESTKQATLAQAYAMRAYVYFVMARTWGALPLLTDPVEGYDPVTTFQTRVPVEEVFSLIESDIDKAYGMFPDNKYGSGRKFWSKPALDMLKAEVYLWTARRMNGGNQDLNKALEALNEAGQSDVALLDDFSKIFSYDNKGNKEVILASRFADLEAGNNYFADMYIVSTDLNPSMGTQALQTVGVGGGNNWWAPTALVRNQFASEDQRRNASFIELYNDKNGAKSYVTSVVLKGKGFVDGGIRKFLDDVIIYRYADLLLMKAEVKNALGQDPSPEINQVRRRAYGNTFEQFRFVNGTKEANDEAILKERLLEFAFEGKRWWDLVRFGKAFEKVPSLKGRQNDQYLLLWPIPLQTLSLNSKLVQNPGYK